jgi:hypothetical protein
MAVKDLTPSQTRALEFLREHAPMRPRHLAQLMWPDSPAWGKTTRSRPGFNGSKGGTMPMLGAKLLWALRDKGEAYLDSNDNWWPMRTERITGEDT